MRPSRRGFLKGLSMTVLASNLGSKVFSADAGKKMRLPIAFSTLGCPSWEWKKILDFARQHRFAAIELRGLEGNLDLPSHTIFAPDRIEQRKREIRENQLKIACVSSSANLYFADQEKRTKELGDARRFIDLAARLGAPFVRVFGGKEESDRSRLPDQETKARVAAGLHELGNYAGPRRVKVLLESHDHFTATPSLKDVLHAANSHHVGLLWDAHHTFADSNEEPEFTVKQLGPWMGHTHLKDSTGSGEDRHYVLTGRGNVPIRRQIESLRSSGYKGFYCFEWEKLWHPDLEAPEIAIADFARVVGECMGDRQACGA
jgi:sugar phosphate isomerase/epimerase